LPPTSAPSWSAAESPELFSWEEMAPVQGAPIPGGPRMVTVPVVVEPIAPVASVPVESAPVVSAPVAPAPVEPAPVASVPVAPAPAPVMAAHVASVPVESAPVAGVQLATSPAYVRMTSALPGSAVLRDGGPDASAGRPDLAGRTPTAPPASKRRNDTPPPASRQLAPRSAERAQDGNDRLTGSRRADEALASKAAGFQGEPPSTHMWHHVEDEGTMMLVPEDLHRSAGHTGGRAAFKHRTGVDYAD